MAEGWVTMSGLDREVLARIERLGLKPRPPIYFLARRSVFWILALISLLLGAISIAVAIFAMTDLALTGGRGLDEMPFDDIATSLPLLWLVCFALFTLSAAVSVTKTRRGYRYRPLGIVATALAASLGLGLALQVFDAGGKTHRLLAANFASYQHYTYIPYAEWSRPAEGYLGGEVLSVNGAILRLRDFRGSEWSVDISAATNSVDEPLADEGDVAIRGKVTGPQEFTAQSIAEFD